MPRGKKQMTIEEKIENLNKRISDINKTKKNIEEEIKSRKKQLDKINQNIAEISAELELLKSQKISIIFAEKYNMDINKLYEAVNNNDISDLNASDKSEKSQLSGETRAETESTAAVPLNYSCNNIIKNN